MSEMKKKRVTEGRALALYQAHRDRCVNGCALGRNGETHIVDMCVQGVELLLEYLEADNDS